MFKSVLVLDNRYIIVNSVVAEYNERRKKVSFLEGAGRGHRGHNILLSYVGEYEGTFSVKKMFCSREHFSNDYKNKNCGAM